MEGGPPQATGDAAPPAGRRSGPKGQAGASAGGLAGAPPSHPRRSGGPYRRPAARRRCAAAAPWRGRPGNGLWPGLNKISLFCTPEGPWLGGPQHTTRTLSARPSHGPRGLANCGAAGLCIPHSLDGVPAIIQNNLFCSDRARRGQRLNLWRRRSPGWRNARPPGAASGASLALGRGTGGSGELTWRTT